MAITDLSAALDEIDRLLAGRANSLGEKKGGGPLQPGSRQPRPVRRIDCGVPARSGNPNFRDENR